MFDVPGTMPEQPYSDTKVGKMTSSIKKNLRPVFADENAGLNPFTAMPAQALFCFRTGTIGCAGLLCRAAVLPVRKELSASRNLFRVYISGFSGWALFQIVRGQFSAQGV